MESGEISAAGRWCSGTGVLIAASISGDKVCTALNGLGMLPEDTGSCLYDLDGDTELLACMDEAADT